MNGMSDLRFSEITPEELDAISLGTPHSSFIQSAAWRGRSHEGGRRRASG